MHLIKLKPKLASFISYSKKTLSDTISINFKIALTRETQIVLN